ncbi:MAG: PIN domain-containing protein [Terriglobales bacterium]
MKIFIDSNVALYAVDSREPAKSTCAKLWLERLGQQGTGCLSWQIVHEFYWNATGKLKVEASAARGFVEELLLWETIAPSARLVRRAWEWCDAAQVAYWDALIVAAAEVSGARYLLSEDLQAGREFGGVLVVDPFGDAGAELLKTLS